VKLVRAIRKGWLKTEEQKARAEEPPVYLMWGDDGLAGEGASKTATGLSYIPPPKPRLPGHEESYNPPAEYIPTEVSSSLWGNEEQ
jgi:ribosome biogenesis protein ERB1